MLKNKFAVLALGLGLIACQKMQANSNVVVKSFDQAVALTKAIVTWGVKDNWQVALPGLATVAGVALYQFNESFRNSVRQMIGLAPITKSKCCCSCSSCSKCCNKSMPMMMEEHCRPCSSRP